MKQIDYNSWSHIIIDFDFNHPDEMDDYVCEWKENSTKSLGLEPVCYDVSTMVVKRYELINPNLCPRTLAERELYDFLKQ